MAALSAQAPTRPIDPRSRASLSPLTNRWERNWAAAVRMHDVPPAPLSARACVGVDGTLGALVGEAACSSLVLPRGGKRQNGPPSRSRS
jgi:hypothetical protein